jgi:hypothetical protein
MDKSVEMLLEFSRTGQNNKKIFNQKEKTKRL